MTIDRAKRRLRHLDGSPPICPDRYDLTSVELRLPKVYQRATATYLFHLPSWNMSIRRLESRVAEHRDAPLIVSLSASNTATHRSLPQIREQIRNGRPGAESRSSHCDGQEEPRFESKWHHSHPRIRARRCAAIATSRRSPTNQCCARSRTHISGDRRNQRWQHRCHSGQRNRYASSVRRRPAC